MRKLQILLFILILSELGAAPARSADQPRTIHEVIDRVIENEHRSNQQLRNFTPLVETYIQNVRPDKDLGYVPADDRYFLGHADFSKGVALVSLNDTNGKGKKILGSVGSFFSFAMQLLPDGFLQMIFIDPNGFDKERYKFDYVRREFLGEVRCLVFDVTPQERGGKGRFLGRIWVEDQGFNVVRFNGAYAGGGRTTSSFHYDSWRTNALPGLWLPSFIYSEQKNLHYALKKELHFKAQTRLWGYNLGHVPQEQELSKILVETPVQDDTKASNDLPPVLAQRSWDRQAEENLTDRLQRIGVIAPQGEVDKILDTVVNNLQVTNNLDIDPEVRCRVLMTTTLESFALGHTIVLSRGLIDVLPDEASLATVLAHELGHVVLGHRMETTYAFFDQLLVDERDTFRHFGFARTPAEEQAASAKAVELLKNSPYKNQLANAGLFLTALRARQREIPNLISAHVGDQVSALVDLKAVGSPDGKNNSPPLIAALPIGGRVKLDPWNDKLELIKNRPVGAVAEREKMPFEITPFMPYLVRYAAEASEPIAAGVRPSRPGQNKEE